MLAGVRTADFNYELPAELIAQTPASQRDQSRLMVLHRDSGRLEHRRFSDLLDYFEPGDVLVLNDSRVIPARLRGVNARTGGQFEILLLEENTANDWWAMVRPGKRARPGTQILLHGPAGRPARVQATVLATNDDGHRRLHFTGTPNIREALDELGEVPLPPYIERVNARRAALDRERYQTVYAGPAGSVAAPTAGLHFTQSMLEQVRSRGVQVCFLTLHVGAGTFAPVKTENISDHALHEERYELSETTVRMINEARQTGRRIIAAGTTTVRVLESVAARGQGRLAAGAGRTRIFIFPPHHFQIVDRLLTNFHLPRSSLLMLASAFAAPNETHGRDLLLSAYAEAIRLRYRFFSYGDAMLIL